MTNINRDGYTNLQLRLSQEAHTLVSLFIDPENPDDFIAGYVCALGARYVALQSVSPFGQYDGFLVARLCDINLIMGEDDYTLRLRQALTLRGEQPPAFLEPIGAEDPMHLLCRYASENARVITVWTAESEYCGLVRELDDIRLTIDALDYFGRDPQPVTLPLRELEIASVGSSDDTLMELLYKGSGVDLLRPGE